jgi:Uma2 family endonuclease
MSGSARRRIGAEEFLEWAAGQEGRHEFARGEVVTVAGVDRRHGTVIANLHGILFNALRGSAYRYFTAGLAILTPNGHVRCADAGIDHGPRQDSSTTATAPFLVAEVLSPSTRALDLVIKLEEYKTIPTLAHIVLIDPDAPQAFHWRRPAGGDWAHADIQGLDAAIDIPEIPCALALAELYEGLAFAPPADLGLLTA